MSASWSTPGGWTVEVVRLSLTPDKHDGTWLRVRHFDWFVADVRAVNDLARFFPLAELSPEALAQLRNSGPQMIFVKIHVLSELVGMARFELAASCSQSIRGVHSGYW